MNKKIVVIVIAALLGISVSSAAQQMKATRPTEVIGRICKTGEQHPPPTPEANYALLDYAVCGPGGLRVYPIPQLKDAFDDIKFGVKGKRPGKKLVYLYGYTRTQVLPAFGTKNTPSWHPRFRFTWLEVHRLRRDISFHKKPRVRHRDGIMTVTVEMTNPLDKPITDTDVVLRLKSQRYPRPIKKKVPVMRPGKTEKVVFTLPLEGKTPDGSVLISNYGWVYIDIEEDI